MTQVTVDDVMQGNGHASDDERRSGFECGGWAMGRFADDTIELIRDTYQRADAFLFGRQTYEMFAETWGAIDEMRADPTGVALNEKAKYVASTTLTDPHWANSTVLSGDLASAVRQLKNAPGGELQVHGSGDLVSWLLSHDLINGRRSRRPPPADDLPRHHRSLRRRPDLRRWQRLRPRADRE